MSHGQNVTGQNVTWTKCHTEKMSWDKMSHGQNVTGQNVTWTKCHTEKMS